jgi:hypothetical protein
MNWRVTNKEENDLKSDVIFVGLSDIQKIAPKLKPFQKLNHFPGIQCLSNKYYLGKVLNAMQKQLPDDFNFHPKTFLLPKDMAGL